MVLGGGRRRAAWRHVVPLASCAVLLLAAASTGVAAPVDVPGVAVPEVSVPEVAVPAPPVPAPIPAPAVPVPAPPSPPPVDVPAPVLPAVTAPATPSVAATTHAAAPRQAVDAGAVVSTTARAAAEHLFGAPPSGSRGDQPARSRGLFGTRYRKPRWFVRRLRGCLDEIPTTSRRLLVMRYGVGRFEPTPAATVARRLDLGRREYDVVRKRALRRLAVAARRSRCEGERLTTTAVVSPAGVLGVAASLPAPIAALAAEPPAEAGPQGDVLGRSKRGGRKERPVPPPAAVPPLDLASPDSDLPFILALLAASTVFGWLVYMRARRSKKALEDPAAVTRLRR
jgi:hypothetical protein